MLDTVRMAIQGGHCNEMEARGKAALDSLACGSSVSTQHSKQGVIAQDSSRTNLLHPWADKHHNEL